MQCNIKQLKQVINQWHNLFNNSLHQDHNNLQEATKLILHKF